MRLIVAMDEKGGIGKNYSLLAYLPTDLKFFRRMTLGKTVIMGHGTLVSLPGGRPLPGRRNIVLSRTLGGGTGYEVARSLSELAELIRDEPGNNVLVIGGAQIYEKLIPYCDYAYVTEIKGDLGADTFITPMQDRPEWVALHESTEFHENGHIFSFRMYENRNVRGVNMKNYEKYREPLLERLAKGGFFSLINGHVSNCSAIHCDNCEFDKFSGHSGCSDARRAWLNAEAASTLASDERKLCELLKTGYIAQDEDGDTWYFVSEPRKEFGDGWCSTGGECIDVGEVFGLIFEGVHDIKTKAWKVEDLLALEVCD